MEKKQANIVMIGGIAINVLLLLFLIFMYWKSIPQEGDLNPAELVVKPAIYDTNLEKELDDLKKAQGLPISVDPSEIGKQNPYNF
jgi:hypothetical protein